MAYFVITLIVLFILSFTGISKKWLFLLLAVLAFFLGFRGETVGDDTMRYINYYYGVDTHYNVGYMEIGWNYLSEFFRSLRLSAYAFHFIVALITLMLWGYVTDKVTTNNRMRGYALFFLYTLGFYLYMFNGMRQFLAVSIVLLGFYLLSKRRIYIFVFLVGLATLFHYSAIFSLLIYPMLKMKLTKKSILWTLILTFVLGIVASESWFYLVVGKYSSELEHFGFRTSLLYAGSVGLLTNLFFYWLVVNNYKSISDIWMKYFFFSVVVLNILSSVVYGPRIVYYFSFTQTIALAIYLVQVNRKLTIPFVYLYALITFGRYLLPELWKTEESLLPYYMTLKFFE